jgi:hypothetical protein
MNILALLTLIQIAVILMIGLFFGSLLMFYWNYKEISNLSILVDSCQRRLANYEPDYEDDSYEAY